MDQQFAEFQCKSCNWKGNSSTIEWDIVETCMGSDHTEMCPVCGSLDIKGMGENVRNQIRTTQTN